MATSLPRRADVLVNCWPSSCMPSPESPTNRTVIPLTNSTGFSIVDDAWLDIFEWLIMVGARGWTVRVVSILRVERVQLFWQKYQGLSMSNGRKFCSDPPDCDLGTNTANTAPTTLFPHALSRFSANRPPEPAIDVQSKAGSCDKKSMIARKSALNR